MTTGRINQIAFVAVLSNGGRESLDLEDRPHEQSSEATAGSVRSCF